MSLSHYGPCIFRSFMFKGEHYIMLAKYSGKIDILIITSLRISNIMTGLMTPLILIVMII